MRNSLSQMDLSCLVVRVFIDAYNADPKKLLSAKAVIHGVDKKIPRRKKTRRHALNSVTSTVHALVTNGVLFSTKTDAATVFGLTNAAIDRLHNIRGNNDATIQQVVAEIAANSTNLTVTYTENNRMPRTGINEPETARSPQPKPTGPAVKNSVKETTTTNPVENVAQPPSVQQQNTNTVYAEVQHMLDAERKKTAAAVREMLAEFKTEFFAAAANHSAPAPITPQCAPAIAVPKQVLRWEEDCAMGRLVADVGANIVYAIFQQIASREPGVDAALQDTFGAGGVPRPTPVNGRIQDTIDPSVAVHALRVCQQVLSGIKNYCAECALENRELDQKELLGYCAALLDAAHDMELGNGRRAPMLRQRTPRRFALTGSSKIYYDQYTPETA